MLSNVILARTLQDRLNDGSQGELTVQNGWVVKTARKGSTEMKTEYQFLKAGARFGVCPKSFMKKNDLYIKLIDNGLTLREVLEGLEGGIVSFSEAKDAIEKTIEQFVQLHQKVECCQVDAHAGNTLIYQDENEEIQAILIDFGQGRWIDSWTEGLEDFLILGSQIQGYSDELYQFFIELVISEGYPSPDFLDI
jgi:hypothetical protein